MVSPAPMLRTLLEFEYFTSHDRHVMRVHAQPIDLTPVTPGLDYAYTSTNTGPTAETRVSHTVTNLALLWQLYYSDRWELHLRHIFAVTALGDVGDLAIDFVGTPPWFGINTAPSGPGEPTTQRVFRLTSRLANQRRFWLRQTQFTQLQPSVLLSPTAGGVSPEDQGILDYLSGDATALLAADGTPFLPTAAVRARNDAPMAPNVPGTSYIQDVQPPIGLPGDLWTDTSQPGPPYPMYGFIVGRAWVRLN